MHTNPRQRDDCCNARPDPVVLDPPNLDLFSYTYQNPIRYRDPNGKCPDGQIGVIGGGSAYCSDTQGFAESYPATADFVGNIAGFFYRPDGRMTNPITSERLSATEMQDAGMSIVTAAVPAPTVEKAVVGAAKAGASKLWSAGLKGGDNTVFWSGPGTREVANTLGTTLDKTPIGNLLDKIEKIPGVKLPRKVWDEASKQFAENAQGVATAVLNNPTARSTWNRIEKGVLEAKGTLVNIVTHHLDP